MEAGDVRIDLNRLIYELHGELHVIRLPRDHAEQMQRVRVSRVLREQLAIDCLGLEGFPRDGVPRRDRSLGRASSSRYCKAMPTTDDDQLLGDFEACTLPFAQWTHRMHVKVTVLYLQRNPF